MDIVQAIILGIIQGVFEWLPVSSEAVITLVMTRLYGAGAIESVNTAVWLHTGTMLAALIYFRGTFWNLVTAFELPDDSFSTYAEDQQLLVFLLIATAITGILGGAIYLVGLKTVAAYPDAFAALMGIALFVTGILRLYSTEAARTVEEASMNDAVVAGLLQSFSVLPGISRSGSTVFGLLYRDFSGEDAFKLSFLMSVPAILVANVGLNLVSGFTVSGGLVLAAGVAFVVSYVTIDVVLAFADRAGVAYLCFVLGVLSFVPVVL